MGCHPEGEPITVRTQHLSTIDACVFFYIFLLISLFSFLIYTNKEDITMKNKRNAKREKRKKKTCEKKEEQKKERNRKKKTLPFF